MTYNTETKCKTVIKMPETIALPVTIEMEMKALVRDGHYANLNEAIKDAFRTLLNVRPEFVGHITDFRIFEVTLLRQEEVGFLEKLRDEQRKLGSGGGGSAVLNGSNISWIEKYNLR